MGGYEDFDDRKTVYVEDDNIDDFTWNLLVFFEDLGVISDKQLDDILEEYN
jgi:glycosylphosphatidylinositol transamidase (GPIT) subunit GPI8